MSGLLDGDLAGTALHIAIGLGTGLVLGLAHFFTLRWNTGLYLGRRPILGLGVQLLRFTALAAVLFALTRLGAGALMSGALGVLAARRFVPSGARGSP